MDSDGGDVVVILYKAVVGTMRIMMVVMMVVTLEVTMVMMTSIYVVVTAFHALL